MKNFITTFAFVFIISSVFIGIGVWLLTSNSNLIEHGISADGIISTLVQKTDSEGGRTWYPVVEFTTNNGKQFSKEMTFGSSPPAYNTGDAVEVLYYAGNPDSAVINSYFQMYVFPWIFIGVGIFIEFIMIIVYIITKQKNNNLPLRSSVNSSDSVSEHDSLYDKTSDKDKENPFLMD